MDIRFEFVHPVYGVYKDALCLPDDHSFTDSEIEAMKQQRYDNWVAYIETPPVEQSIEEMSILEIPPVEEPVIEE